MSEGKNDTDLANLLFGSMQRYRRRIAFVETSQYRSKKYRYAEVIEGAQRIADSFKAQSIGEGDRIILWGENSVRWAMTFYACLLQKCVAIPLDASYSEEFVRRIQSRTDAALVLNDREGAKWNELLKSPGEPSLVFRKEPADSTLQIVFTSGTTGDPKGVIITYRNVLANLLPVYREYLKYKTLAYLFSPLRFIQLIPFSHLFGQMMGLFIPQLIGGTVVLGVTSPPQIVQSSKRLHASAVITVPQELTLLRKHINGRYKPSIQEDTDRSLWTKVLSRWWRNRRIHNAFGWKFWAFISGGATLPLEEERFWANLGFAVIQGYGLTETAPSITITHPFKGIKAGYVGQKLPDLEVKIAEDGEILVRGPQVSPGYYKDAEATKEMFREGWLHTGDLGRMDPDGNLQLLGRKKEIIVTSEGLNVYPLDVEAVLDRDPIIRESAVVARDLNGRTVVHAVLVLEDGYGEVDAGESIRQANDQLEVFQRIQSFSIWPERALPRTSTGKLKRLGIASGVTEESVPEGRIQSIAQDLLAGGGDRRRILEDLGLTSLDRVELMMELENSTGIRLDEASFSRATNLEEVAQLLNEPGKARNHYPYWKWPLWWPVRWLRYFLWHAIVFPLLPLRVELTVSGLENLKGWKPPVLFVSNHQSILDAPIILRALPSFALRRLLAPAMGDDRSGPELFLSAIFFNIYPLPRTNIGLREALQHTGYLADRGYSSLVFPEGERSPDGKLMPFRPGIGVIAERTRLPVVPIIVRGVSDIWPAGARGPTRKGSVHVEFAPAVDLSGKDAATITRYLESWYQQHF